LRGQTEKRLAVGGFAIVALAGGGLLFLRYGGTTATIAIAIVLGGAGVLAVLWLLLSLMEAWSRSE
jgi:hypothetical protein